MQILLNICISWLDFIGNRSLSFQLYDEALEFLKEAVVKVGTPKVLSGRKHSASAPSSNLSHYYKALLKSLRLHEFNHSYTNLSGDTYESTC